MVSIHLSMNRLHAGEERMMNLVSLSIGNARLLRPTQAEEGVSERDATTEQDRLERHGLCNPDRICTCSYG